MGNGRCVVESFVELRKVSARDNLEENNKKSNGDQKPFVFEHPQSPDQAHTTHNLPVLLVLNLPVVVHDDWWRVDLEENKGEECGGMGGGGTSSLDMKRGFKSPHSALATRGLTRLISCCGLRKRAKKTFSWRRKCSVS
jgi:hypothetical protein